MFLQAIIIWAYLACSFFLIGPMTTKSDLGHFLYWPRLVGQHSSILASLNLFAFLSTFSSFHSINCKKGHLISSHHDLMLGQGIYLRVATETGAGLLHSLRCVYKMKLLVAFNSEI